MRTPDFQPTLPKCPVCKAELREMKKTSDQGLFFEHLRFACGSEAKQAQTAREWTWTAGCPGAMAMAISLAVED